MKNYKDLLGDSNETWLHAIERYQFFCNEQMNEYFDIQHPYQFSNNPAYAYHAKAKMTPHYLNDFGNKHATHIPDSLIGLLTHHGAFTIGNTILQIFDHNTGIMTLQQVVEQYNYQSIVNLMGTGMFDSINEYYFFFGVTFPQTDEASFLFFSRAGLCGKMHINTDNHHQVLKKVFPSMFNGSIDKYTTDSLISNQIDRVIINALKVKGYIE